MLRFEMKPRNAKVNAQERISGAALGELRFKNGVLIRHGRPILAK